jgi:predicted neutral ceramidase superfamily lipid hydrolase
MNRGLAWTEKIIAVLLIVFACVKIYALSFSMYWTFDIAFNQAHLTWKEISLTKVVSNYHLETILSLATLVGAILLLCNKKPGWILTAAISIIGLVQFIIMLVKFKGDKHQLGNDLWLYLLPGILIAVYLTFLILLLQKPFRIKYAMTRKSWLTILLLVLIYFTDSIIFSSRY